MSVAAPHDVARRLIFFGSLAVLVGVFCVVLALLQLALPLLARLLPAGQLAAAPRAAVAGFVVYAAAGGVLIWAGVGSARRRRWSRPIMLIIAWTWLITGIFGTLLVVLVVDDLLQVAVADVAPQQPEVVLLVKLMLLAGAVGGGLLVPAAFIWVYRDPRVQATCERHDPLPGWSDRVPIGVLGLSAGLWGAAALCLPLAIQPAVPWFGRLVTGWPGAALMLAGAVACAWLGRSVFRLEPAGWWATAVFLTAIGVSTAWTLAVGDPAELYRSLGYPEEQISALERSGALDPWVTVSLSVLLTLATLAYLIGVRRDYVGSTESPRGH